MSESINQLASLVDNLQRGGVLPQISDQEVAPVANRIDEKQKQTSAQNEALCLFQSCKRRRYLKDLTPINQDVATNTCEEAYEYQDNDSVISDDDTYSVVSSDTSDYDLDNINGLEPELHKAARTGNNTELLQLINSGADVNMLGQFSQTPLHEAARSGQLSCVKTLLQNGAKQQQQDINFKSALHYAVQQGYNLIVKELLEYSSKYINCEAYRQENALHYAALMGNLDAVKMLISKGANMYAKAVGGYTPLDYAAKGGYNRIIRAMVEGGCNIRNKESNRQALALSLSYNRFNCARMLVKLGVDVSQKEMDKSAPIHFAFGRIQGDPTKKLDKLFLVLNDMIAKGADVNEKGYCNVTAIQHAAETSNGKICKLLIKNGAILTLKDEYQQTALHRACFGSNIETMKVLIDQGCDVNIYARDRITPLHISCIQNHVEGVRLLLRSGADVRAISKNFLTPLHRALFSLKQDTNIDLIQELIDYGADVNAEDDSGYTPIFYACQNGVQDAVRLLLNNGADITTTGKNSSTPMHISAFQQKYCCVDLLLEYGLDPDITDQSERTILHYFFCPATSGRHNRA